MKQARSPFSFLHGKLLLATHTAMRLMALVDAINEIYGRDTIFFAVQGTTRLWKMKQEKLSGRFTTRWSEILTVQ